MRFTRRRASWSIARGSARGCRFSAACRGEVEGCGNAASCSRNQQRRAPMGRDVRCFARPAGCSGRCCGIAPTAVQAGSGGGGRGRWALARPTLEGRGISTVCFQASRHCVRPPRCSLSHVRGRGIAQSVSTTPHLQSTAGRTGGDARCALMRGLRGNALPNANISG